jgi:hypothetical protein
MDLIFMMVLVFMMKQIIILLMIMSYGTLEDIRLILILHEGQRGITPLLQILV